MEMRLTMRRPGRTSYDVTGTTFDELSDAMDAHGCWGRYSFPFSQRLIGPPDDVQRINLTISPSIEMPRWRWRGRGEPTEVQQREWDRMITALDRHEAEHHRLLTRKAEEFRDSLPNISQTMDRRAVGRLMQDFQREAQAVMDDFDRTSDHGRRQGVTLNDV